MSTLVDTPSPVKRNPDWNNQVKVGRGHNDLGAFHRAIAVAANLFKNGQWNGRGLVIIHDPYRTYGKQDFYREELVAGTDYEFENDSVYQGAGPVEAESPTLEDLTTQYTRLASKLDALMDYLSPMTLAQMAAEIVGDNVDNRSEWTGALQEAYHLVCHTGIEMVGEEEWDAMVAEVLAR